MRNHQDFGPVAAEGKTKTIFCSNKEPYVGYAIAKDRVTWGDIHSMDMPGKGAWSTAVNHNMCTLFERAGLPVAYIGLIDEETFATKLCDMLPYEVVAYGIVDDKSSYRKRNPGIPAQTCFTDPEVQIHLKTSMKSHAGILLPCDDPLMVFEGDDVSLYLPSKPIHEQEPIFTVSRSEARNVFPGMEHMPEMTALTIRAFTVAREAYKSVGGKLYDLKLEYGIARNPTLGDKLLLGDVCDPDSMRLTVNGRRADKQVIRNGGAAAYQEQVEAYLLAVETSNNLV